MYLAISLILSQASAVPPPWGSMSLHNGITSNACSGLSTFPSVSYIFQLIQLKHLQKCTKKSPSLPHQNLVTVLQNRYRKTHLCHPSNSLNAPPSYPSSSYSPFPRLTINPSLHPLYISFSLILSSPPSN